MQQVFNLLHRVVRDGQADRKGGGVYSSLGAAQDALAKLSRQPGFRDYPDGFSIHRCIVGLSYAPFGLDSDQNTLADDVATPMEVIARNTTLYRLYNQSTIDDAEHDDDFILIGFFHSQVAAEQIAEQLKGTPEFSRPNREFGISTPVVDRIEWSEGFISVEEAMKQFR